jgi:hypothetical protein
VSDREKIVFDNDFGEEEAQTDEFSHSEDQLAGGGSLDGIALEAAAMVVPG